MGTSATQDRFRSTFDDLLRRWDLHRPQERPFSDSDLHDLAGDLADAARQVVRELMAETF